MRGRKVDTPKVGKECNDDGFLLTFSVALGPSLSRSSLQTEHFKHNMQRMHAFLLSFFVTVENKRFVNPTPKRKVARWNRAGGTSFPTPDLFVS